MDVTVCLSTIRNLYSSLTAAEKKMADYVLEYPERVVEATTVALSEDSGVAPSCINRFCRKIGYAGFPQFKLALALEMSSNAEDDKDVFSSLQPNESVEKIVDKVFATSIRTLKDTQKLLTPALLNQAVEILDTPNDLLFLGVGTSATIAVDAQYRLMQLGYRATQATDVLNMRVAAMNLRPGDVAIGISHSGKTKDTITALRIAKERGASTLAITSFLGSPMCQWADCVLQVCSDERSYPVEAVSARMAHICLLDSLTMALALRHYETSCTKLNQRNEALKDIRL